MEKASEESRRVVGSMHGASFSQVWPKAAHDDVPVPGRGHRRAGRSLSLRVAVTVRFSWFCPPRGVNGTLLF